MKRLLLALVAVLSLSSVSFGQSPYWRRSGINAFDGGGYRYGRMYSPYGNPYGSLDYGSLGYGAGGYGGYYGGFGNYQPWSSFNNGPYTQFYSGTVTPFGYAPYSFTTPNYGGFGWY